MISIIIPIEKHQEYIKPVLESLRKHPSGQLYEVIVIEKGKNNETQSKLNRELVLHPLKIYRNNSDLISSRDLLEVASGEIIVLINSFSILTESILDTASKLQYDDILTTNNKLLYNLTDQTSPITVLKKEVFQAINTTQSSLKKLTQEIIFKAKKAGFSIVNYEIAATQKLSKLNLINKSFTALIGNIINKTKKIAPQPILPIEGSMQNAGVGWNGKRYITHTTLSPKLSALQSLYFWQKAVIFSLISLFLFGLTQDALLTMQIFIGTLSIVYFIDVIFNLFLVIKTLKKPTTIQVSDEEIKSVNDNNLPTYTILCPLYNEAHVIPKFIDSISKLDWDKNKLDVILLLEEDDLASQEKVKNITLPPYIRAEIVPQSQPKTKPKACNWGLSIAKGEYLVIYDAEDIPEPLQLKKAYIAFSKVETNVACLQAKLNYYNPHDNLLTRLFTAEYSLWFDVILTGLQSLNTSIPLGGTSNHFRTKVLRQLKGWDAFNVTEDADLGLRLFRNNLTTAMIDSTTLEEANSRLNNWVRQRSRWIKGYMQTYLVHMRDPLNFTLQKGYHVLLFQLIMGGKIAFILINPILWIATISYFLLNNLVGPTIESFYPTYIFYIAVISLVFGNFMFMYYYMIGLAQRDHWGLLKYLIFVPFYWVLVSYAGFIALKQLITKPHYWEKTVHGIEFLESQGNFNTNTQNTNLTPQDLINSRREVKIAKENQNVAFN